MAKDRYVIEPIGVIRSALTNLEDAPLQGDEGGYEAWLELTSQVAQGWPNQTRRQINYFDMLHRAERDVLQVHRAGI